MYGVGIAQPRGKDPGVSPGTTTKLDEARRDRATGVLLGQACGDALGVPYEFLDPPLGLEDEPEMRGGGLGPYEPAEYSDDTQMAVCIAQVAAEGSDLTTDDALDEVAERFLKWSEWEASDIGMQTARVLAAARTGTGRPAERLRREARRLHEQTGKTAGNGALMRTGIVGLVALDDLETTARAARSVAELTHADALAAESCILWSVGVAIAVKQGTFAGVRQALDFLPSGSRDYWAARLDEAEQGPPDIFRPNGFTVPALQAAYSSICTELASSAPPNGTSIGLHFKRCLTTAIRIGDDTDTVAAICGALLGARWGASAIPDRWRADIHGWPGLRGEDLGSLGILTASGGGG